MANQSNAFAVDARINSTSNLGVGSLNVAGNSIVGGLAYLTETLTGNAAAVVASPSIPISFVGDATTAYGNGITLADGATVGQQKQFIYTVAGNSALITPANRNGAYPSLQFVTGNGIGQCFTLVWTAQGWSIVSRSSGATGNNPGAVAGYPVIA